MRCPWAGITDGEYARYHDEEWGVPLTEDQALFEKLVLEGFQSGLSWLTILKKRENFRRAFHAFDARRMARYGARDIDRLMNDAGIVRNRAKIEGAIDNAKAFVELNKRTSFASYIWRLAECDGQSSSRATRRGARSDGDGPAAARHSLSDIPASTEVSARLSADLKVQGFRFVGPTTVYAFMQSAGMVNDHLVSCPRHKICGKLQRVWRQQIA